MRYRLAEKRDIEPICKLVASAIGEMENRRIFQWDSIYPTKEDFLDDMQKGTLYIGILDHDISVVYKLSCIKIHTEAVNGVITPSDENVLPGSEKKIDSY